MHKAALQVDGHKSSRAITRSQCMPSSFVPIVPCHPRDLRWTQHAYHALGTYYWLTRYVIHRWIYVVPFSLFSIGLSICYQSPFTVLFDIFLYCSYMFEWKIPLTNNTHYTFSYYCVELFRLRTLYAAVRHWVPVYFISSVLFVLALLYLQSIVF